MGDGMYDSALVILGGGDRGHNRDCSGVGLMRGGGICH